MTKEQTIKVQNILLTLVDRPEVPDRMSIDLEYIKELAASIAEIGLMNPVVVTEKNGRYEIVAGDCRYQAFVSLGKTEIPAVVKKLDVKDISITRATENLQRKDLTIIEEARTYKRLHDDLSMSWDEIAKRTGKSAGLVKRRYDLLKMPEILVNALHAKKITYTVAEELYRLADLGKCKYYLDFCIDHGATTAVARGWVDEELALQRQHAGDIGGAPWGNPIPDQKPIYVPCDLCTGPMEISTVIMLRVCGTCHNTIKQNM